MQIGGSTAVFSCPIELLQQPDDLIGTRKLVPVHVERLVKKMRRHGFLSTHPITAVCLDRKVFPMLADNQKLPSLTSVTAAEMSRLF